jgi:hypothetical protein
LAGFAAAALLFAASPAAAMAPASDWTIIKADGGCFAAGAADGDTDITIAYIGPLPFLIVASSQLPADKGTAPVLMGFDQGAPLQVPAEGDHHTYGILLTRQIGEQLRAAKILRLGIGGEVAAFPLGDAAGAMDAAARCAGAPTFAQSLADAPTPIAGAGGWKLGRNVSPTHACMAIANGADVDVMLMLTQTGATLLSAGSNGWNATAASIQATLQIDDTPPLPLKFSQMANMVLLVADDALVPRLRGATTLTWHLPSGDYRATVTGLGIALDALATCHGAP